MNCDFGDTLVCPHNPEHLVKRRGYTRHIKTCPSRPEANPCFNCAFVVPGCNGLESPQQTSNAEDIFSGVDLAALSRMPDLFAVFEKLVDDAFCKHRESPLISAYEAVDPTYATSFLSVDRLYNPDIWVLGEKHGKQCCSIIQNLLNERVLFPTAAAAQEHLGAPVVTTLIEAGSGTGMLSAVLSLMQPDEENKVRIASITPAKKVAPSERLPDRLSRLHKCVLYLVERERGYQKKYDRYVRASGEPCHRLPIDLQDLCVEKLPSDPKYGIEPLLGEYVARCPDDSGHAYKSIITIIGKHLCNGATDITIRMAVASPHVYSLGIALCCHAKGDGSQYCNLPFLHSLGIVGNAVRLAHKAVSWDLAFLGQLDLTDMQRRQVAVGRQCRALLDLGRALYLTEHKFSIRILKYASPEITPERYLLCGRRTMTWQRR